MQIQNRDGDETLPKVWNLPDQVPAQIQFIKFSQLQDALWHGGDLLETEVQTSLSLQRQPHTVLSRFQGDGLAFSRTGFLSSAHPAAGTQGRDVGS